MIRKKYSFIIPQNRDEILLRFSHFVEEHVSKYSIIGMNEPDPEKPFAGFFDTTKFQIWRRLRYRNGFQPYFYGRWKEVDGQTIVYGEIRPSYIVLIFWAIWMVGASIGVIAVLVDMIRNGAFSGAIILVLVVWWVGFSMQLMSLTSEVSKIKLFLKEAFPELKECEN